MHRVGYSFQPVARPHKKVTAEQLRDRQRCPIPFHVIINPRVIRSEGNDVEFFEGGLRVAGYSAIVPRDHAVTVEYLDERAETRTVDAVGWYARILQHEIDHLAGTLYVDRMKTHTFTALENLERFWKVVPVKEVQKRLKAHKRD